MNTTATHSTRGPLARFGRRIAAIVAEMNDVAAGWPARSTPRSVTDPSWASPRGRTN